jgi:ferrous iron transport protein B
MSSCCQSSETPTSSAGTITVALAGNPNSGKTTVFNALTGLRQKVANYPGVTVEKKVGRCKLPDGSWCEVIDLPGTYSLISRSPDEQIAMEVLRGIRTDVKQPDVVVVIVDASNLQRNLYLVSQLIELGRPLVVALNMMDVAERRGINISPDKLQQELGAPVVGVVGSRGRGIKELKQAIAHAQVAPMPDWRLPDAMKEELLLVGGGLSLLVPDDSPRPLDRYQAIAERLLIGDHAADISRLVARQPVSSLLTSATSRLHQLGIDPMQADVEAHYHWIESVVSRVSDDPKNNVGTLAYVGARPSNLTERVDAILCHRVWGLLIFAVIMGGLFVALFWLAKPIMDSIQNGINALGALVTAHMSEGPIRALVRDGIFNGVGTVVVFVPQIAMLFLFLAILEDSGYLARAAFLMDRLLAKVGLHGKSFIPLLSSFACAIPGIMATRTIENRRERLATILVAPFMSCSARLPVYTLLIGAFFATYGAMTQAGIMLACYLLGILAAVGTALIFKRTLAKGPATSFILELPTYKIPQLSQVLRQVWVNTRAFLTKAGTTIFCLSIILWALAYYPTLPKSQAAQIEQETRARLDPQLADSLAWKSDVNRPTEATIDDAVRNAQGAAQSRNSFAGRIGRMMEPAIRPLGFDWKMGVGLVSAFAAREVFVSSMGIVYSVGKIDSEETTSLSAAMRADRYSDGKPVWTPLVAVSLLVWFVLAMQCMSTFAIVRRETGGWRWPMFMLAYMNVLAYVVSFVVFQVGSRIF